MKTSAQKATQRRKLDQGEGMEIKVGRGWVLVHTKMLQLRQELACLGSEKLLIFASISKIYILCGVRFHMRSH